MKKISVAILGVAVLLAFPLLAEEMKLGKPISVKSATPIQDILSRPQEYIGKDVRIEGEIIEVCQNMGCWINVKDASSSEAIQVKVDDGVIVFPKDGAGKKVIAQGKLEKLVMTKQEYIASLEHMAKESGKKVDTSKITEGKTIYRIRGEGAIIN